MLAIITAIMLGGVLPPSEVIPDGSLIFLEHGNRAVERFTDSPITHVGMVIDGWVYEATPPKVRKIKVEEYDAELAKEQKENTKLIARLYLPAKEYSGEQIDQLRNYLSKQIGREYTIWGYILGRPVNGFHCSQLASSALNTTGRFRFTKPCKVDPGDLEKAVSKQYKVVWLIGRE